MAASSRRLVSSWGRSASGSSSADGADPPPLSLSASSGQILRRQGSVASSKIEFTKMKPFRLPPAEHPYDLDYDSNTSLWLVTSAALVYGDAERCKSVTLGLWDMKACEFFDVQKPGVDTQAMAYCNDDFIVVAFRGTTNADDWKTNLDAVHVKLNDLPQYSHIDVHRGFNTACLAVLPLIEAWILETGGKGANPQKPLYICGHSLGGALATLCYAHWTLRENPISVNGVVTIGQPRVGTRHFVTAMEENGPCVLQRIFNANDVVPTVPPTIKGYRHYGCPIYFDASGNLHRRPASKTTRRDKTKAWIRGKSGVAAHGTQHYLECVRKYDSMLEKKAASVAVYKAILTFHSARGLKAADSTGKSDPFVIVEYHDITHTGPIAVQTLDPVWEHQIVLPEVSDHEVLRIQVWDSDSKSGRSLRSDFLGQFQIHLDQCKDFDRVEYTLAPRPGRKDTGIKGTVCVSAQFLLIRGAVEIPCAKVTGRLIAARDVKAADGGKSSDCYARIFCNSFHKKTPTIMKTLNPDWNFDFVIPSVVPDDVMYVDVWDYDAGSKDDFLGRATIVFNDDFPNVEEAEFPLEPRVGHREDTGIIGSVFLDFKFELQPMTGHKVATGVVTVHGARGLKAADSNGKSDPFVLGFIGVEGSANYSTFKTPIIKKTLDPSWELSFPISKVIAGVPMKFEVWDHDTIGSNDFLGLVEVRFSAYNDIDHEWYPLASRVTHTDRGIIGDLCLSFKWVPV